MIGSISIEALSLLRVSMLSLIVIKRPVERKSVKLIVKVFIPDEVAHHDLLLSEDSVFIFTLRAVLVLLIQLLHSFLS